jgi:rhamnose utilization protein RhaD (predicted bifunctional aldolase and dehydrogenase)/NAD(P)-dependent dehydrogenase (short-subunit alcohol dehydrogenase family)
MNSLWDNQESKQFQTDLEMRAYTSRLLGASSDLVLHGGGNTSVKITQNNLFNEPEDLLYIKGSGHDLKTIQQNGFSPVLLDKMIRLASLDGLSDTDMVTEMRKALTNPTAPTPSVETILHALIPYKFVDHTHADSIVAISNTPNGEELLKEIYGERILILPYVMAGFVLAKQVYEALNNNPIENYDGIILCHHGAITFGDDAKTSYESMIAMVTKAEDYLNEKKIFDIADSQPKKEAANVQALQIAKLRKEYSLKNQKPTLVRLRQEDNVRLFCEHESIKEISHKGPLTPDHVIHTKRLPLYISQPLNNNNEEASKLIEGYSKNYRQYFEHNAQSEHVCLTPLPAYSIWKDTGSLVFATNSKKLNVISDINDHTFKSILQSEALGGHTPVGENDAFDIEYWELEQAKLRSGKSAPSLEGQVVCVTGGASGIGQAMTETYLKNGACVIALDIKPEIKTCFEGPSYLGIECDILKDEDIKNAFEQGVKYFGGMDTLILNAGAFPKSAPIEDMDFSLWDFSMKINLGSQLKSLNYATPYLKEGFNPSVLIIGSKNVPAPGPGASAYSVAKAGLTQLARVAALELGQYNIRVNTLHPNAVFDTGIWSDEVLEQRASHYKMSIEEYKTNNLLKTKITSLDVARVALEMTGPVFSKTTGAQIPIDGGNDRVI